MGHFRIATSLYSKTRLNAKTLIGEQVSFSLVATAEASFPWWEKRPLLASACREKLIFLKEDFTLGLGLKVRVFETWKSQAFF